MAFGSTAPAGGFTLGNTSPFADGGWEEGGRGWGWGLGGHTPSVIPVEHSGFVWQLKFLRHHRTRVVIDIPVLGGIRHMSADCIKGGRRVQ